MASRASLAAGVLAALIAPSDAYVLHSAGHSAVAVVGCSSPQPCLSFGLPATIPAQTSHSRASITTMKASDESVGRSSEIGMGMGDEPDILLSEVVDGCSVDDPHLEACLVSDACWLTAIACMSTFGFLVQRDAAPLRL